MSTLEKIENAVVEGYKNIEEGETVEEAKERIAKENAERLAYANLTFCDIMRR